MNKVIILKNDVFDRFVNACAEVRKPNKALLDAAAKTLGGKVGNKK